MDGVGGAKRPPGQTGGRVACGVEKRGKKECFARGEGRRREAVERAAIAGDARPGTGP